MELDKRKKITIDFWLIGIVVILMFFGLLMLANATGFPDSPEGSNWLQYFADMDKTAIGRHSLFFGMGCVLAGIIAWFDYKLYGELSIFLYALSLIMLLAVVLFGTDNYGQKRLEITDSIEVQPSEVSKIALIVTLAWDLSKKERGIQKIGELVLILIKVMIPLVLILMQPDLGTALVYIFITAILLIASGTNKILLGLLTASGVIAGHTDVEFGV